MRASQSALLHGSELSLRWGSHSMSSCDGVSPIVFIALVQTTNTLTTRSGAIACPNCLPAIFNDFDILASAMKLSG